MESLWVGVDLDGTLAYYKAWDCDKIGPPIPAMVARVKEWLADGLDIRIFTARVACSGETNWRGEVDDLAFANSQRELIKAWCSEHLGKVLPITATKTLSCIALYDDKAVSIETNTGRITSEPPF